MIGAGAIGSLFASHMSRVAEVWVLTRREENARQLNEEGLKVSGKSDFVAKVNAVSDVADLPDFDIGIVASKSTQIEEVAKQLSGKFPHATLVTIQNGLGADEILHRYGDWKIISGTTMMGGIRRSDAHVDYELDRPTWIGPYAETDTPYELVSEVGDLITASGLKVKVFEDLRPAQWSKLIFTGAIGSVCAATGIPHNPHLVNLSDESGVGCLSRDLVNEGKAVADAAGIELYEDPWEMNILAIERGRTPEGDYNHPPSILEDVRAKRKTEIDFFCGALVREAERVGVSVPMLKTLYRIVKGIELSWEK